MDVAYHVIGSTLLALLVLLLVVLSAATALGQPAQPVLTGSEPVHSTPADLQPSIDAEALQPAMRGW